MLAVAAAAITLDSVFTKEPPWGRMISRVSWSPDGQRFLYVRPSQDPDESLAVMLYDVASGSTRVWLRAGTLPRTPEVAGWAPGGARVALLAGGDLYAASLRDPHPQKVAQDVERRFYDEALTYYIALNLERPAASIAGSLAEIEFASGDVPAALHRAEEARVGHEAWHNPRSVANDLCNMAAYLVAMDCFDDSLVHATEALAIARDVKATVLTAYVLQHFAAIGALEKYSETRRQTSNRERAAMLLGFVNARLAALQAGREYTEQQEYARILAALREDLGEKLETVMALGAELTEDGAASVALEL